MASRSSAPLLLVLTIAIVCTAPTCAFPDLRGLADSLARMLTICPAGYYSSTGTSPCHPCPVGSFTNKTGATSCVVCPAGTSQDHIASTSCQRCKPGNYQPTAGQAHCRACAVGTYTSATGATSCTACAPGSAQDGTGHTSCERCNRGYYQALPGQVHCRACGAGTYSNVTGATTCSQCPAGTSQDDAARSSCDRCRPGEYQPLAGQSHCLACAAGSFSNTTSATSCSLCGAGTKSNSGQSKCTPCSAGQYQPSTGARTCLTCPINTFALPGSTACTSCTSHGTAAPGSSQCTCRDTGYSVCPAQNSYDCSIFLPTNLTNCGTCGNNCFLTVLNTKPICSNGVCNYTTCNANAFDCDKDRTNGCETQLQDLNNCGVCGETCTSVVHATKLCNNATTPATCDYTTCQPDWGNCDGDRTTGCETQLQDLSNCGACAETCSAVVHATPLCNTTQSPAACDFTICDGNWGNCDSDNTNGCETQLTDLTNCGACGETCAGVQHIVTTVCNTTHSPATCSFDACATGWFDCDGDPTNGCESDLTALGNCGACGQTCSGVLNAGGVTCLASQCDFGTCNAGFSDCNGNAADGCEANLHTDPNNCGTCGNACTTGKVCGQDPAHRGSFICM